MDSMKNALGQYLDHQFLQWQISQGGSKTVIEFAQYLEVSRDALYKWMNGKRVPDFESIKILAEKLGPEVYESIGLKPPNMHLQSIELIWDSLSEEQQETYAAEIREQAERNKQKAPARRKHE